MFVHAALNLLCRVCFANVCANLTTCVCSRVESGRGEQAEGTLPVCVASAAKRLPSVHPAGVRPGAAPRRQTDPASAPPRSLITHR